MSVACSKCGAPREVGQRCRPCHLAWRRSDHRDKNKSAHNARDRAYYWANRERLRGTRTADCRMCGRCAEVNYTSLCSECVVIYNAAAYAKRAHVLRVSALTSYYAHRPAKQAYSRAYCARNKTRLRRQRRARYAFAAEKVLSYGRARRARKRNAPGFHTVAEWLICLSENGHRCIDCGTAGKLTIGHMRPLAAGGSHWIHNIRPQCRSCNSRQGKNLHALVAQCQIDVIDAAAEFFEANPPEIAA